MTRGSKKAVAVIAGITILGLGTPSALASYSLPAQAENRNVQAVGSKVLPFASYGKAYSAAEKALNAKFEQLEAEYIAIKQAESKRAEQETAVEWAKYNEALAAIRLKYSNLLPRSPEEAEAINEKVKAEEKEAMDAFNAAGMITFNAMEKVYSAAEDQMKIGKAAATAQFRKAVAMLQSKKYYVTVSGPALPKSISPANKRAYFIAKGTMAISIEKAKTTRKFAMEDFSAMMKEKYNAIKAIRDTKISDAYLIYRTVERNETATAEEKKAAKTVFQAVKQSARDEFNVSNAPLEEEYESTKYKLEDAEKASKLLAKKVFEKTVDRLTK